MATKAADEYRILPVDREKKAEIIGPGGSSGNSSGGSSNSGSSGNTGAPNYSINYENERFKQVENEKQQALKDVDDTYTGMINDSDKYYQAQIEASKDWADKQQQLQQENTDFTIEQIEQQKAQANKDYLREQSGAYTDWQKQSNQYGANAEQMAASGLTNTGYSESSQVSMYNTYQNRVATARESYNQAVLNYNNSIKDAQLQNNSALAEIAYTALQQQLELSLQGFQYKNQLVTDRMNKKLEVDNMYYNRYQDVLNQMNTENALAEDIRQFNENIQLEREQLQEQIRQYEQDYALRLKEFEESIRQFDEEMERLRKKDDREAQLERERLALQKQQMQQEQERWEKEYQATMSQLKAQQQQLSSRISKTDDTDIEKPSGINGAPYKVNTAYYQGALSRHAKKYGTMANGYQPQGIIGHGNVKKTGDTITFQTETLSGQKQTVTQNIWRTSDNKLWYWDGRKNDYVELDTSNKAKASGKNILRQ